MAVSNVMGQVLKARRPYFNQCILEARHKLVSFDAESFRIFLQNQVDPLIIAVNEINSGAVYQAVSDAYELSIELIGKNLAGPSSKSDTVNIAWQICAPNYAHLIALDPYRLLGSLTNAALKVASFDNASLDQWFREMNSLSKLIKTLDEFFIAGNIVAWRSGLAHLRKTALNAGAKLPKELAIKAISSTDYQDPTVIYQKLLVDPWAGLTSFSDYNFQKTGKFIGYGGALEFPPEIQVSDEDIFVKSGTNYFQLFADSFGAVLLPTDKLMFQMARQPKISNSINSNGAIGKAALKLFPKDYINVVKNSKNTILYSPYSYSILISGVNA